MTTSADGGAEFAAVELLDALAARGHDCVMLTDRPAIARDTAVRVRPVEIGPKLSLSSWRALLLRWPLLVRDLRRALEAEAPFDVLLVHYKKEQLLARWLPRRLRAKLVWAEWGPVPYPLRKGLPRRMYVSAATRAELVMAISEGTRRSVTDVGVPDWKVEVVHNVMRTEQLGFTADGRARVRRDLGIPEDAFVVGCISRFHPKKRNDVVVEAVTELADPRVHLVLAGGGETEQELRAQATALDGRAHFVPTPQSDVNEVLSAFDVSVFCPSPTEGQPRAVILAMLAERPALSTGAEGVSDMISDDRGHILSPENDARALATALRRYVGDAELVRRQGLAGRDFALRTYDAPVVAAHVEALFTA